MVTNLNGFGIADQKDAVNKMTSFIDEIETAVSAVVNSVDSGRSYEGMVYFD